VHEKEQEVSFIMELQKYLGGSRLFLFKVLIIVSLNLTRGYKRNLKSNEGQTPRKSKTLSIVLHMYN
jgi:hypothetical protein